MRNGLWFVVAALAVIGWAVPAQAETCPKSCPEGQRIAKWSYLAKAGGDNCDEYKQVCRCVPDSKYLAGKLSLAEAEIERLKGVISTLEGDNATLAARVAELEREVAMLKGQVATLTGERDEAVAEAGRLTIRVTELEGQVEALTADVDRLTADNVRLTAENVDLKAFKPWQLRFRGSMAVRVVDPPRTCANCQQKRSFGTGFDIGFAYEWHPMAGLLGPSLGVFGRLGSDSMGEFFGGGGAAFELAIYPEKSRTFAMAVDIRGMVEANKTVVQFNVDGGIGLGARFSHWRFMIGPRVSRYGMTDQGITPWFGFEIAAGL